MQVRTDRVVPKASIVRGEVIHIADQDWLSVPGMIDGARSNPIKPPDALEGKIGRHADLGRLLSDLVKNLGRELIESLVGDGASFAGRGVRGHARCGVQRRNRLLHRQDWQWLDKRTGCWA